MTNNVPRFRVFGIDGDTFVEHPAETLEQAYLLQEEYSNPNYKAKIWDGEEKHFLGEPHEHRGR